MNRETHQFTAILFENLHNMQKKITLILFLLVLIFSPRLIAGYNNRHAAQEAAQNGDFALAAEHYERAAYQLFWQGDLWNETARAKLISGQREAARLAYQKAKEKNALSAFGWDYLALDAWEKGNRTQALEFWQEGLLRYPDYLEFYLRLATAYRTAGDYSNEKNILQKRLAAESESKDAAYFHYRLGLLLLPDSPETALSELTLATRADPQFAPVADTLRTSLNLALLESDPAEKQVLLGRGLALAGEWDLAAHMLNNATQDYPKSASAWAWLGEAQQHIGENPRAALDRALSLDPQSAVIHSLRGLYWQRQGDTQQALQEFEAAVQLEPKNPHWQTALAEAYAQNGDLTLALAAYQKATQLAPNEPRYWQFLALFSVKYGVQIEEVGLEAAKKAVELAPHDAALTDTLGWVYFGMEKDEEAAEYFAKALALDESWSAARLHLGMLYLKQGHADLAKEALLRARDETKDPTVAAEATRLLSQYFQE